MRSVKYYVEIKSKEGYEWNDGFFTYALESSLSRATEEMKKIQKKGKNARVKSWDGKIVLLGKQKEER